MTMLPPIRYPLPSFLALVVVVVATWKGEAWTRDARKALANRVRVAVQGPPVPHSAHPQVIAGPVTRRALLLRDDVPASARPGGRAVETIGRRRFVEVFDRWPAFGPTTDLRVGNRTAIGWVAAGNLVAWDTRLVILPPGGRLRLADSAGSANAADVDVGPGACPVVGWTDQSVEVAVWDRDRPWSKVARRGWIGVNAIPADAWGVWISDVELPIALRVAFGDDPSAARTLACLGHLVDGQAWSRADLVAAKGALPPALPPAPADPKKARERLAEANASPRADASWSGFSFRALPLDHLP